MTRIVFQKGPQFLQAQLELNTHLYQSHLGVM